VVSYNDNCNGKYVKRWQFKGTVMYVAVRMQADEGNTRHGLRLEL